MSTFLDVIELVLDILLDPGVSSNKKKFRKNQFVRKWDSNEQDKHFNQVTYKDSTGIKSKRVSAGSALTKEEYEELEIEDKKNKYSVFEQNTESETTEEPFLTLEERMKRRNQHMGSSTLNTTYTKTDSFLEHSNIETEEMIQSSDFEQTIEPSFDSNQLVLEVMFLTYVFHEDDGKINRKERKEIQNHFKKYKHNLNRNTLSKLEELESIDPSLLNIRAHISQNNIDEETVKEALRLIEMVSQNNSKYQSAYRSLYSGLLETMGF
jgi:hypothetical protein